MFKNKKIFRSLRSRQFEAQASFMSPSKGDSLLFSKGVLRKRLALIGGLIPTTLFATLAHAQTTEARSSEKKVDTDPIQIEAEALEGKPNRFLKLDREIKITKSDTQIQADQAEYNYLIDTVKATGNVELTRDKDCYWGNVLQMQLQSGAGFLENLRYRLTRPDSTQATGKADRVDFQDQERSRITRGTYSTCKGLEPDWYLKAETLSLDTGLDRGIASKSILYFKDVPILQTPSFSFPLSSARHTGVLPPEVGATTTGGIDITIPYYFNIAPNRDLTIYPKIIARRGLQLGVEGRYLGENYAGENKIEVLPNDRVKNETRYALTSMHQQKLLPNLELNWNVNVASDDDYAADFSRSITTTAQRLLLRESNLTYYGSFWSANLKATSYQVLQDPLAPIVRPYDRLPQLTVHAGQSDLFGLDWSFDGILTRFWHPSLPRGDRLILNPQIRLPFERAGYFVTPKISFHASNYHLTNPTPGQEFDFHRFVPMFSLDSGLIFDREVSLAGKKVTQTLEPRLFYVKIPYRDQTGFPNFDSAVADFNFAQIFSENRFTGQDRIGDANQITTALVSRFLTSEGEEAIKLALGQRFYLNQQRVSIDSTKSQSRSDLLLAAQGKISDTWYGDMAMQLSQSNRQNVKSYYSLRWQPEAKKVLNLAYRYQRDTLEQIDLSSQWPIAPRWYAVGRSNYSMSDKKLVDALAGFEYKADCWSLRFLIQRFAVNSTSSSSGFALQLELSGLTKLGVGSNPIEVLRRNIPGYQPIDRTR